MTNCFLCGKPTPAEFTRDSEPCYHSLRFGDKELELTMHKECYRKVVDANRQKTKFKAAIIEPDYRIDDPVEAREIQVFAAETLVLKIVYLHHEGRGVRAIAKELGTNRNRVFRVVRSVQSLENNVSNTETS